MGVTRTQLRPDDLRTVARATVRGWIGADLAGDPAGIRIVSDDVDADIPAGQFGDFAVAELVAAFEIVGALLGRASDLERRPMLEVWQEIALPLP